jgi:hypothetical protein
VAGLLGLLSAAPGAWSEVFVYPKPGAAPDQMQRDQYECHNSATAQTGVNPQQPMVAAAPPPASGGAVRGGARGAAVGAIGGAIGGNAGKGAAIGAAVGGTASLMRQNQYNRDAAATAAQSQAQQQNNLDRYERSYAACMAGRGYQVR